MNVGRWLFSIGLMVALVATGLMVESDKSLLAAVIGFGSVITSIGLQMMLEAKDD